MAEKTVKKETVVAFQTKNGPVAFEARKPAKERVVVDFMAKNKKK